MTVRRKCSIKRNSKQPAEPGEKDGGLVMAKRKYTKEMHQFILEHYKSVPVKELARMFNCHFDADVTEVAMKSYLTNRKMRNGRPTGYSAGVYSKQFPKEVAEYIYCNYKGTGHKAMADALNDKFGTAYTASQIKGYYGNHKLNSGLSGRFEKGQVPANKGQKMSPEVYEKCKGTMFKKGNIPGNHREVGSERITKDGYIEVKIAEPNKWRLKHLVVWEEVNGPLPEGHAILFLDDNTQNVDISNLRLVTRSELLIMNRQRLKSSNADVTDAAVILAKLIDQTNKKVRKNKKIS